MYGASKAAVKLLTEGLYAELADTNVGVTVAFPGAVHTDISKHSGVVPNASAGAADGKTAAIKMISPVDAAAIMIDAIERQAYRVMVGPDARMMDRLTRFSPKLAADIIQKQMSSLLGD